MIVECKKCGIPMDKFSPSDGTYWKCKECGKIEIRYEEDEGR